MPSPTTKKRGPFMFISVFCCLLIGLAILFIAFSNYKFSSVGQIIADAKGTQSATTTTELESPIHTMQLFMETYEDANTSYTFEYPQFENDNFNAMIAQFVNTEKDVFLTLASETPSDEIKKLTTNVEIASYNEQLYSITFHKATTFGKDTVSDEVSTFMFDSNTSQFITLQQLLKNHDRYLHTFSQFVYEQLTTNESLQGQLVDDETLQQVVTPLWDSYSNFAIDNNELVIYFNPGAVADFDAGVVEVRGELAYLYPILSKTLQAKVAPAKSMIPLYKDKGKRVALTFDDGPHNVVTQQILNILDEFDAKATFFMLGRNVEKYPEIAQDVQSRGHEIGNHTWSHPILTKLTLEEAKSEFERTEQMIVDTLGEHSTVFRPPFGSINKEIKNVIPLQSVNWSIDTLDWKHRDPKKTLQIVKATMHNNAVILMHDIHQPTADSLRSVLQYLQQEGYEFLTVSEILPYVDYSM